MPLIKPIDLMRDLVADFDFLTPVFVASVLKKVMPFSDTWASHTMLFEMPVSRADGPGENDADIAIILSDREALERLHEAFKSNLVQFETRLMRQEALGGHLIDYLPETGGFDDFPFGIFGFVEAYSGICIRIHSRLQCLAVQLG
jgi:hypothetical protein